MAVTIQDEMWEAACELCDKQRDAFLAALVRYAFEGVEPPKTSKIYPMFVLCRTRLDMSKKGHEQAKQDAEARSESARKAANARWSKSADAMRPHDADAMRPHDPPTDAYEVRLGEDRLGVDTPLPPSDGPTAGEFVPPTPEEVDLFIEMSGYRGFTGEEFCAHYGAQGWRRANGLPMTDWRSAVTAWALERRPGGRRYNRGSLGEEVAERIRSEITFMEEVAS